MDGLALGVGNDYRMGCVGRGRGQHAVLVNAPTNAMNSGIWAYGAPACGGQLP
jgi:hypothetical protein